ncbi:protein-L-isoaspartate(D-aspartate) O-methyltransferase [Chitinilyticum litopenaei]|uniref:protein-L-isoaspartate(D-aspartate) O-methyltransferase n=1 Tax=Chitinilyticum litopenaei TaxID=1121276 RepID=UPI0003FD4E20|nr:protein-L-isoaspartate(D-aspartate) O-methyltransferase [Chitinilyticum litopenaei]
MAIRLNSAHLAGSGMVSARTRARMIDRLREQGISNSEVLAVMEQVPRHLFVDEALQHKAYDDTSLPIGHGQTISQPYIVARMTELALGAGARDKVLEIGTGCGYQATILAQLFKTVYSIERIGALAQASRHRLAELGVHNARLRHADGSKGVPEAAPFDVILFAAAAPISPEHLIAQLAPHGRLIVPVGQHSQELVLICQENGNWVESRLEPVRFVPLLGGVAH